LPTYLNVANNPKDRERYTFVAKPRKSETLQRLKGTLESLKSGIDVSDVKNTKHGHVFEMGGKKITILYTKEETFDFFCNVSTYGINSILGKITKGSNLKLTQEGLYYEEKLGIENHNSKVGHVLITKDFDDLMTILELSTKQFHEGFEHQDDMFAFIANSPYLKTSVFTNPKNEHKHSMYEAFQAYLLLNDIEKPGDNISYEELDGMFPEVNFLAEIDKLKAEEKRKRESINKFNGRVILDHFPDLDKKKIGTSMGYFKHSFEGVEDYKDFLSDNSIDVILNKFQEIVKF